MKGTRKQATMSEAEAMDSTGGLQGTYHRSDQLRNRTVGDMYEEIKSGSQKRASTRGCMFENELYRTIKRDRERQTSRRETQALSPPDISLYFCRGVPSAQGLRYTSVMQPASEQHHGP